MNISNQDYINLKELDSSLLCGICFEYMNNTLMISKCSHNYCSLCIRSYCRYKLQCPMCMEPFIETDLFTNRCLDKIVHLFSLIKPKLLKLFNISNLNPSNDLIATNINDSIDNEDADFFNKSINSEQSFVIKKKNNIKEMKTSISTSQSKQKLQNVFNSKTSSNSKDVVSQINITVCCPVCSVEIPSLNINLHLDKCLKGINGQVNDCIIVGSNVKRKQLPKLVYALLSEKDLRKKLTEIGLPSNGDKQKLIKRHQEYVLFYNSQCDSLNPKPVEEIVKEIVKKENNKSGSLTSPTKIFKIDKTTSIEEIDVIKKNYIAQHKDHFSDLIAKAKKNWNKPNENIKLTDRESNLNHPIKNNFEMDSSVYSNNIVDKNQDLNNSNSDEIFKLKNNNNNLTDNVTSNKDTNNIESNHLFHLFEDNIISENYDIYSNCLNEDNLNDIQLSSENIFISDKLVKVNSVERDLKSRNSRIFKKDEPLNNIDKKLSNNSYVPITSENTIAYKLPISFSFENAIKKSITSQKMNDLPISVHQPTNIENIVNISHLESKENGIEQFELSTDTNEKLINNKNLVETTKIINLKNNIKNTEHNENSFITSKYFDTNKCEKTIGNSLSNRFHDDNGYTQQLDEVGLELISLNSNLKIDNNNSDITLKNDSTGMICDPPKFINMKKSNKNQKPIILQKECLISNSDLENVLNPNSPNFDFLDEDFLFTDVSKNGVNLDQEENDIFNNQIRNIEYPENETFNPCNDGSDDLENYDTDIKLSQNSKLKLSPVFEKKLKNIPRLSLLPCTQNDKNEEQHSDDDIFLDFYKSPTSYKILKQANNKLPSMVCEKRASPQNELPRRNLMRTSKRKTSDLKDINRSNHDSCKLKKLRTKK